MSSISMKSDGRIVHETNIISLCFQKGKFFMTKPVRVFDFNKVHTCVCAYVCPTCIRVWRDTDRYCVELPSNRIQEREFRLEPHYRFVTARVHKTVDGRPGGETTIRLNLSSTGNIVADLNRFRTIRLWPTELSSKSLGKSLRFADRVPDGGLSSTHRRRRPKSAVLPN